MPIAEMGILVEPLPDNIPYRDQITGQAMRAANFAPAFAEVAKVFWMNEEGVFTAQGPGWKPLAASTIAKKGSDEILVDTEDLEKSLTGANAGSIVRVEPLNRTSQSVFMGTDVKDSRGHFYAGFQQFGFSHATGMQVPARPPVNILPATIYMWDRILKNWFVEGDPVSI